MSMRWYVFWWSALLAVGGRSSRREASMPAATKRPVTCWRTGSSRNDVVLISRREPGAALSTLAHRFTQVSESLARALQEPKVTGPPAYAGLGSGAFCGG